MTLPLNIEDLRKAVSQGKRFKYIFFWGHRQKRSDAVDKSCFSQWFPARFELEGHTYGSAEHYMMAEKARLFGDDEIREKILNASNPAAAKQFGRQVRGFVDTVWQAECFDIVVRGNHAKFSQNAELGAYLASTKNRVIVEASPVDRIWGIGMAHDDEHVENPLKWQGLNLLGFALMKARDLARVD